MANYSAKWYVEHNDLDGAYNRFQKTKSNWKDHWWTVVEAIYNTCADWAKKYLLDPIKRLLTPILQKKKRGRPAKYVADELLTMECEVSGCGTYFVEHYANGKKLWGKCGKADDGLKRLKQHFQQDYKGRIDHGIVKLWYPCINSNHALAMEDAMRDYFQRKLGLTLLGNDRFPDFVELTTEDIKNLNRRYEVSKMLFE